MEQYKKVELGEELPPCKDEGLHAWIHDGMIWDMPQRINEPKRPPTEFPFLWTCAKCGMFIRTRKMIPGFQLPEFPGFDNKPENEKRE